jgi:hypothetical protein
MSTQFDSYFPKEDWTRDTEGIPQAISMYRYKTTDLRVALFPGLVPGTKEVCGTFVLFRYQDDSMNMEASVPLDKKILQATIQTAVELSAPKKLSHDKFVANLCTWFTTKILNVIDVDDSADKEADEKTYSTVDGERSDRSTTVYSPSLPTPPTPPPSSASSSTSSTTKTEKRKHADDSDNEVGRVMQVGGSRTQIYRVRQTIPIGSHNVWKIPREDGLPVDTPRKKSPAKKEDPPQKEETEKCCVCLDNEPDTIAIPCGCRVVCTACSLILNKDRKQMGQCAVCRQQMTHVAYPDNTVKSTSSRHEDSIFVEGE